MQKIKVATITTALCAGVMLLAACDTAPAGSVVIPTASNSNPTVTVVAPAETATTVTGATAQPTSNGGGNMQENITVTDFQVWQDFMPSINKEGAPLHAAITLSVEGLDITSGSGVLTLKRAAGEELVTANLELMRQADDLGLRQPGPQPVTFTMQSTSVKAPLTEGETVKGTADIKFGSQERTIELPETQVFFTH